jgi:HEAT repeat protein
VLAALNSKLASPSPDTRVAALDALVQLDGNSSAVLAEAVKNLGDEAHTVRAHAALAIGKLSCDRREAVAPLIAALADENSYVRTAAAISLGRIGPAALAAAPALREAATDPYNSISNAQSRHGNSVRLSTIGARVRIRELNRLSAEQASRGEIAAIEPESGKILGEK